MDNTSEPKPIITDQSALRQVSKKAQQSEQLDIVKEVFASFPKKDLGLAAPQIGIFKRVFVAKVNNKIHAFVNPVLEFPSTFKVPSDEACLSLPGISRCVDRHSHVVVNADDIFAVSDESIEICDCRWMELIGSDAFVIQHENDHLDGVLLIDHESVKSRSEIIAERNKERRDRIDKKRQAKEKNKTTPVKMNEKRKQRLEDEFKKHAKRVQKYDWIKQNYEQQRLINLDSQ
jgi:peptide deformylase